jgi:hypothetical protein
MVGCVSAGGVLPTPRVSQISDYLSTSLPLEILRSNRPPLKGALIKNVKLIKRVVINFWMSRGKFELNMTNDLETKQSARFWAGFVIQTMKKNRKINLIEYPASDIVTRCWCERLGNDSVPDS